MTLRPPAPVHRRIRRFAAALAAVTAAASAWLAAPPAAHASLPPTPSGWTQVFADDFNGAANTGLNTGNWLYDLGTSYPGGAANWGTGEVETMTNSTAERLPGRHRPPGHQADPRRLRQLDQRPGRDPAHRLRRPGRRQAALRGVAAAAQRQRRGRGRLLAGVLVARRGRPRHRRHRLAGHRRDRRDGGHQRAQLGVRHAALWRLAGRPVQRDHRHRQRRSAPAAAARPASTPTRWSTTAASRRSRSAGTSTATTSSPSTPTRSTRPPGTTPPTTASS